MKNKSQMLSVICLSHLTPNINNIHHYYLASIVVVAKTKIMFIDELSYFMLAERKVRAQRAHLMCRRAVITQTLIKAISSDKVHK